MDFTRLRKSGMNYTGEYNFYCLRFRSDIE